MDGANIKITVLSVTLNRGEWTATLAGSFISIESTTGTY